MIRCRSDKKIKVTQLIVKCPLLCYHNRSFNISQEGIRHMSKICANCGSQLDDDAVFCGNCGTPVQNNTSTGSNESKGGIAGAINKFIDNVKKKDGKSIGILAGAGGVLVLLIVLIIVLSVSGSSQDKGAHNRQGYGAQLSFQ